MLGRFELYLIDNGWDIHEYHRHIKWTLVPKTHIESLYYSTMGDVSFLFIKDDKEIIFGLGEDNRPPTLINPIPQFIRDRDNGMPYYRTDDVIRFMDSHEPEEILKIIYAATNT